MRGRLHSHRFQRRLLWGSFTLAVAAGVVGGAILIGDTGRSLQAPTVDAPPRVYREPPKLHLSAAQRQELLATSLVFVRTAVVRKDLDRAYDIASPTLRQGMDRRAWHTGNIPVVPFPAVALATWGVAYSYAGDVGLDLSLLAPPNSDTVGKTFRIELKRYGNRWLVESWVPQGISGSNNVASLRKQLDDQPKPKAPLSAAWLLVPASIFAGAILALAAFGLLNWRKARQAVKRYEAELRGDAS